MVRRLGLRLQLGLILAIVLVLGHLFVWSFWRSARSNIEADLDHTLAGAARLMAKDVLVEYVMALEPGDEESRTYRNTRSRLLDVTNEMRLNRAMVVDSTGNLRVDTNEGSHIGEHVFLLDALTTEMQAATRGTSATTVAYRGTDGALYKSTLVPVRTRDEEVAGILVVEASAGFLGVLDQFRRLMLFVGVISGLAFIVLLVLVSISIVRPIRRLASAASAIGRGEYQTVETFGGGEVRQLGGAFNDMSLALSEKEKELRQLHEREALRAEESERFARAILSSIANGVVSIDRNGEVKVFNAEAARLLGVDAGEVLGRGLDSVSIPSRLLEMFERVLESGAPIRDGQVMFENPRGEHVVASVSAAPYAGREATSVAVNLVITDQTQTAALQEKVKRQETLAAIGQLAAQVAHEVRNPLGSIKIYMDLLGRTNLDDIRRREFTEKISGEIGRLDEIVTGFLEYSAPTRMNPSHFSLNDLLRDAMLFSRKDRDPSLFAFETNIEDCPDISIEADRNQIMQMFLNLMINAVEAMPDGGVVKVELRPRAGGGKAGDAVEVTITDHGVGIPEKTRAEIFQPFYSTKALGTGLGLALVQRVVENHNAHIDIESDPGKGTSVSVVLPLNLSDVSHSQVFGERRDDPHSARR